MKKIVVVIGLILSLSMVLVGCAGNQKYTKEEETYIELANSVIAEKYNVKFDKDDYKYSVGKQVDEGKFDKIAEGETPEIISVSALSKSLPKEGEMLDYSLTYNTKTKTIIQSEMYLQSKEDTMKAK